MSTERFGLDFGTTNSSLAWARGAEQVTLCELDLAAINRHVLRSLLYFSTESREFVVGQRAIEEYLAEDMQGVLMQSIKTFLGDESFDTTWVYDRSFRLEDLISVIFQHVRRVIHTVTREEALLVIGRPAVFVDRPKKERLAQTRLRRAAQLAGFFDVHFQYEPIAAGLAYEAGLTGPELALIADLGGGTSDFTVMRLGSGTRGDRRSDILASGGVQIGGDSFDARIMVQQLGKYFGATTTYRSMEGQRMPFPKHLVSRLGMWHQVPFLRSPKIRELLRRVRESSNDPGTVRAYVELIEGNYAFFLFRAIEAAKTQLSHGTTAVIDFHRDAIDIHEELTRDRFESLIAPDCAGIEQCMRAVLAEAGVQPREVQSVFLTGGSAQIPVIRRLFVESFGADRIKAQDYLTTVALGLGYTAWQPSLGFTGN